MKALVYHGNKDIRLEDVPEPHLRPGLVKLQPTYTGICATDIEEWQHGPLWVAHGTPNELSGRMAPLVLGHEIAARVVEVGDEAVGLAPGDRVAVNNVITCGDCHWCRRGMQAVCPHLSVAGLSADGGLAEFMCWPLGNLVKLPDNVSDQEAGLVEPTTVAVHAVRRSRVKVGDRVAVIGAGTVGLLTMQALKAAGAAVYAVDIRNQALELATRLGADEVINPGAEDAAATLLKLTHGIGPDIVVETAGAAATPGLAIEWTRPGGTTVLVGIYAATPQFDFNSIVGAERTVIGSVAASPGDMETAVRLISNGSIKVQGLISEVVPLERVIPDGFERMILPSKDVFRILVTPGG